MILRWLVVGQICITALFALTSTPQDGYTYVTALLGTVGFFTVMDIAGLLFAYIVRAKEFSSPIDFLKEVW